METNQTTTQNPTPPAPINAADAVRSALAESIAPAEALQMQPQQVTAPPIQQPEQPVQPAAVQPTTPVQPTPEGIEYIRQSLGLDASVSNDAIARAATAALTRHEAYAARIQELESQLQQRQPAAPAPVTPKSFWESQPEWDESLTPLVIQDGQAIKPKDNSPAAIAAAQKAQDYLAWQQQAQARFLKNPKAAMQEMMGAEIDARARKIAEEQHVQTNNQLWLNDYQRRNAHWLMKTQNGQQVTGPDGRGQLSEDGEMFWQMTNALHRSGVTNWQAQADLAEMFVLALREARLAKQPAQPIQQPQQPVQPQTNGTSRGAEIRAASQGRVPSSVAPVRNLDQELQGLGGRDIMRRLMLDAGVTADTSAGDFARAFSG